MTRKDTVNAHGGEVGRHKQLPQQARQKIMDESSYDEAFMANVINLVIKDKVKEEAKAKSND